MSTGITRRQAITTGLKATALLALGGGTAWLAKHKGLLPPSVRGIYGAPEALTYAAQRLLLRDQTLAREFGRDMISKAFPAIGTKDPKDETYQRLRADNFNFWRLPIEGLVERPQAFSLTELKSFPSRTQVTQHVCQEGWSAIGEWTGVPLWRVLELVGVRPEARYVVFYAIDGWWDCVDMADAWHPQTLLAYGMNGGTLPVPHGAPIRLRVERQLGYKSLKFVSRIEIRESVADLGNGKGSDGSRFGYSWYAGI